MPDPSGLLSITLAFFIVTVSPGPANLAVATVAMRSGLKAGLMFGAGLSVGLAFWGLVAASGLGAVLHASSFALGSLKVAGGLYLLWLAFRSGRLAFGLDRPSEPGTAFRDARFRQGLFLNLSNPKAVVAWMAALSMGLGGGDGVAELAVATLVCMALGALNYTGYAPAMTSYRRLSRRIDAVVASLLALAGLALIRSALSRQM